jgi:hydrogenase maturation protein HypF
MASGLCVGGELKSTVAVVRGDEVILSQHLGDLKHTLGFEYFKKAIEDLCRLMEVRPEWVGHDLHPGYLSTQWAKELAGRWGVPLVPVQHHHAHAAAVLAEHGVAEPALAVICDGVGYGTDGTAWGGELLAVRDGAFERLGHLRSILLPGGDASAKDTRRCAAAVLWEMQQAGLCESFHHQLQSLFADAVEAEMVGAMLQAGKACVRSSAAGRWFDAVAGLLGVCMRNDHEAQAPMALEAMASQGRLGNQRAKGALIQQNGAMVIDLLPAVAGILQQAAEGRDRAELAALFHEEFAQIWAEAVGLAAEQTGLRTVGLSGGVFCNALLTNRLTELLTERGLRVLRHELVPPNDGGIAFGQAAVAMARKEQCLCA